jgi:hypothetical protein
VAFGFGGGGRGEIGELGDFIGVVWVGETDNGGA